MTPSEQSYPNGWTVRWDTLFRGTVEARNPLSKRINARVWHKVVLGYLRYVGVPTPAFKVSWEIEWDKRNGKKVWARNPSSKMPTAREWHWIDMHTVERAGMKWQMHSKFDGRFKTKQGYIHLTRRWLTREDEEVADKFGLFRGARKTFVREHHLIAVKKYNIPLNGLVVRHVNGIKDDNRPENILIGTVAENTMDHNTARLMAMYWRERYESLLGQRHLDFTTTTAIDDIRSLLTPQTPAQGTRHP